MLFYESAYGMPGTQMRLLNPGRILQENSKAQVCGLCNGTSIPAWKSNGEDAQLARFIAGFNKIGRGAAGGQAPGYISPVPQRFDLAGKDIIKGKVIANAG